MKTLLATVLGLCVLSGAAHAADWYTVHFDDGNATHCVAMTNASDGEYQTPNSWREHIETLGATFTPVPVPLEMQPHVLAYIVHFAGRKYTSIFVDNLPGCRLIAQNFAEEGGRN